MYYVIISYYIIYHKMCHMMYYVIYNLKRHTTLLDRHNVREKGHYRTLRTIEVRLMLAAVDLFLLPTSSICKSDRNSHEFTLSQTNS
jgi:hypothetical protein